MCVAAHMARIAASRRDAPSFSKASKSHFCRDAVSSCHSCFIRQDYSHVASRCGTDYEHVAVLPTALFSVYLIRQSCQ